MTFGDLPGRVILPTIIPVAVVLLVGCFGIWVALRGDFRGRPARSSHRSESPGRRCYGIKMVAYTIVWLPDLFLVRIDDPNDCFVWPSRGINV